MSDNVSDIITAFVALLPPHAASLTITHNEHRDSYMTVAEFLEDSDAHADSIVDQDILVVGDELWKIQVYPNTPVGFYVVYGPTLESIILKVMES